MIALIIKSMGEQEFDLYQKGRGKILHPPHGGVDNQQ
jgi:hypothetical protein